MSRRRRRSAAAQPDSRAAVALRAHDDGRRGHARPELPQPRTVRRRRRPIARILRLPRARAPRSQGTPQRPINVTLLLLPGDAMRLKLSLPALFVLLPVLHADDKPAPKPLDPTLAKLATMIGGTWTNDNQQFRVEFRYEWIFNKSAVRGIGIIDKGG